MYIDGYQNIVNVDISEIVIEQMKDRNSKKKNMTWLVMDCLKMDFIDGEFDAVIDKSTIDAILCGEYSFYNTAKMLNEVQRVLKHGGIYMSISYGKPETRVFHFKREHLDFGLECYVLSLLISF